MASVWNHPLVAVVFGIRSLSQQPTAKQGKAATQAPVGNEPYPPPPPNNIFCLGGGATSVCACARWCFLCFFWPARTTALAVPHCKHLGSVTNLFLRILLSESDNRLLTRFSLACGWTASTCGFSKCSTFTKRRIRLVGSPNQSHTLGPLIGHNEVKDSHCGGGWPELCIRQGGRRGLLRAGSRQRCGACRSG